MPDSGTNFLLITSDQHNPFVAGFAGDPVVATPNLDRLAEGGTVFDAAYTNSPICMPARAALATGRYASSINSFDNGSPYDGAPTASWGHRLASQGRRAVTFGKLHFDPTADTGFDSRLPLQAKRGYSGALLGWARGEIPPNPIMIRHALDAADGEFEYTLYDRHTTSSACRWLTTDAPRGGPWAAHVSYAYPHYPFRAPAELLPAEDADLPLPPAWQQHDWPANAELAAHRRLMGLDERPLTEDELRNLLRVYYGMVAFLDLQIGLVLRALEASGQRDNTVVLYTSDHGDMLGGHGMLMKSVMYDGSARVPTVIQGPGIDADARCSTAVSLADVFPTAVDVTGCSGLEEDQDLPGRSLIDIGGSPDDEGRVAFSEYHGPLSSAASYLVRKGRWKYVHHVLDGADPQLFDLEADPDELNDRIADSSVEAVRVELDAELRSIVDPEGLDTRVRGIQQELLAKAGGLKSLGERPGNQVKGQVKGQGNIGRGSGPALTDYGVIAGGWTVPPPEIMAVVEQATTES